ncbi:MAG: hypothetical protein WD690_08610 [Vicinamibacterales bacterium]
MPAGPPDPVATGCIHHFAPINLQVSTSWGASARLIPAPGGGGLRAALDAQPGDYWLSIVDINFCGAPGIDTPSPASGVSVNNVVLTRSRVDNGRRVWLFGVSAKGDVRP